MLMSHSQRNAGLIFLGAVAVRLAFHWVTGFLTDDAFITFRYARNIALGLGFVYNEGERVLGTSSPLWALILSLMEVLRIGVIHGAVLISAVASAFTAIIVYRFAEWLRFGRLWIIPVMLYILWPRSLAAEMSGMETAVYTLFITAAFYFQFTRKTYYALAAATLAAVARPEGLLLVAILAAYNLYAHRDEWVGVLAVPAIILLPWLAFATWYFGSPVPNSIVAKLALYSRHGAEQPLDHFLYILGLRQPFGWFLLAGTIFGCRWLYAKQAFGKLELLWLVLTIGFFTFSRTHLFFWYVAPIYPIYLLIASGALLWAVDRSDWLADRQGGLIPILVLVIIVGLGAADIISIRDHRRQQEVSNNVHLAIGWHIRTSSAEGDEVAAEDIGYIGFYSRRDILDRDGLVSPEAIPYNRAGRYGQLVYDYNPDWVVAATASPISRFVTDSLFRSRYEEVRRFPVTDQNRYLLFRRGGEAR